VLIASDLLDILVGVPRDEVLTDERVLFDEYVVGILVATLR
jgi:hypothetical protein